MVMHDGVPRRPRSLRGSRPRCLVLTDDPPQIVAGTLSKLVSPFAQIDPARHVWMPAASTAQMRRA